VRSRLALCAALGCVLSPSVLAQVPPPGGGQLLQQLTLPPPPLPTDRPALSIVEPSKARANSTTPIAVRHIRIRGNTLLPTEQLHALVASGEGRTLTLSELQGLAERITQFYHQHGYPLSRAYVPAQTISDGEVTFAVLEARYGAVTLNNTSMTSTRPLAATLAPVASGSPVSEITLDRTLLLLSDIPGVIVNSTLRPGTAPGTSDLEVDTSDAARYSGLVAVDDFGNPYTGRARGTGVFNINSLLHEGDKLDLTALTSGPGMSYGQLEYRYLLDAEGTTLGVATSDLHYRLSGSLSALEAEGAAQVDSVDVKQPLLRGIDTNLYLQVQFDHRQLDDHVDAAALLTDRRINGGTAVLAGDRRDNSGVFNFNLSADVDHVSFGGAASQLADLLGARTQGTDAHYNLTLARLQQLDQRNDVYLALTGQLANSNLDPADQFYLGGPSNARGYDVGALTGAQGYLASIEWRHVLVPWRGVWLASLFADRGHIEVYKDPFRDELNVATLSDVGVGLHWDGPHEWVVTAQAATPVGPSSPLLHADSGGRVWLQTQKGL
jgi:hemolysin activation/secretion protein